jgi:hypothetical protein
LAGGIQLPSQCWDHVSFGNWSKGCTLSCGPGANRLRQKVVVKCSKATKYQPQAVFLKQQKACHLDRCRSGEKPTPMYPAVPKVATEYLRRRR